MDKFSKQVIKAAFLEDIGRGDITTRATVPRAKKGKATVIAKSSGILSGSGAFRYAYWLASKRVKVVFHILDGQPLKSGTKVATVSGPLWGVLSAERLALNLLAHLSGVATLTAQMVKLARNTKARVLDTRKTTPGLRRLEKKAVRDGGGFNHRFGLYDMILIKDNHIMAAGGIQAALERVKNTQKKVEVEVANFKQLKAAVKYSPDVIMLDNFDPGSMRRAVKFIRSVGPQTKIEASGGINADNLRTIAKTGVDYISIGALTHSAPALDFSLRLHGRVLGLR